jgi:multimeric flavodoxin WrbA
MKIVAINASHRGEKGITASLLDRLSLGAMEAGGEVTTVTLARLKINRCLSCYQCQTPENYLECVYNNRDDARQVFDRIEWADLVIYATPVYMMTMTGLMKNLLDRMYATMDIRDLRLSNGLIHHYINPAISSKPFALLVNCSNLEDESWKNVPAYFRTYARFMETRQVGLLVRNASGLFDIENHPDLPQKFPKVLSVLQAYRDAGRELITDGRISWKTQRRAN